MATPPAYAPQRYASPTMRHASPSSLSPSHFTRHQANHFRRKARQAFRGKAEQDEEEITPKKPFMDNLLGMSFEEVPFSAANPPDDTSIFRTQSVASVATSASLDSSMTGQSAGTGDSARRSSFAPSMCTSSSSFVITPLATPASSRAPSMIQTDSSMESSLPSPIEGYAQEIPDTPAVKGSWVPNFGKMAKAVVHHGMNMSPFGEKKSRKTSGAVKIAPAATDAVYMPEVHVPRPTLEELQRLDEEAAMDRRREWAFEQQQRVQECARLCSQWPQSGYNQMKWGPYGSKHFYEPQSYCNPQHVASVMQRQAELERKLCEESALFFSCRRTSADSSSSSSPTVSSARSSENLSADLSAAMSDSLISKEASPLERVMSGKRSLSDLKSLSMDVDQDPVAPTTRPSRAQSICGFKRPLTSTPATEEEDKRRRVDEAMVVEEAVETGVIQPAKPFSPPVLGGRQLSASTPNLNANADAPAMFGHVVKTSDTHPIIISPFFPEELLKVISQNVTAPQQYGVVPAPASAVLVSSVDVPSLLLSFIPPQIQGQAPMIPPPMLAPTPSPSSVQIGNLLLSSCPGKRLRMEGPVKGRGPVCRDLETDLRRIKNEGVGCLVCCLDDSELALLGVPWENYSAVAASIGLDVVRLPMPDGFTPVSLSLFDAQINLIATKFSLQGINVLVHCRGGVGRAGLTASAWAIKMGFVTPHPSLTLVAESAFAKLRPSELASRVNAPGLYLPSELEHQICMSMVERVIAMIRSRRGLKAIESFEQVQFLAAYVKWLRAGGRV